MAYISTETVKNIRNALKEKFPEYKFAVRQQHHSSLYVSIMKGPLELAQDVRTDYGYTQINHYYLDRTVHGEFYGKIVDCIKEVGEWFDKSDIMTDYFHTAFYFNIEVGRHGKPYEKVPAKGV